MLIAILFGTPTTDEKTGDLFHELSLENNIIAALSFYSLFFGVMWGLFASGVKRLHDMATSGWWMLFMLFPLGIILLGVLIFARGAGGRRRRESDRPPPSDPS